MTIKTLKSNYCVNFFFNFFFFSFKDLVEIQRMEMGIIWFQINEYEKEKIQKYQKVKIQE